MEVYLGKTGFRAAKNKGHCRTSRDLGFRVMSLGNIPPRMETQMERTKESQTGNWG